MRRFGHAAAPVAALCVLSLLALACGGEDGTNLDDLELGAAACQDGQDNDGDGFVDCKDADCQGYTFCQSAAESTYAACTDTTDNDNDGKIDCDDTDCQGFAVCAKVENTPALCQDQKDNDGDGKADCNDTDCQGFTFCQSASEDTAAKCQDTVDNDNDGAVDCADTDCKGFTFCTTTESTAAACQDKKDNDGDGTTDCADTDCQGFTFCVSTQELTPAACQDQKDNDNDGKTDCDDTDCQGYYFCQKTEDTASLCQDKKDNDNDGYTDCDDTECQGYYFCLKTENTSSLCQDKKDNDGDGNTDCDDTECQGFYFCLKLENTPTLCQDQKDNDNDGYTDCKDTDCQGYYFCQSAENTASLCQDKKDNDNDGKTDCDDTDCTGFTFCVKTESTPTQCQDKSDNDGDGKTDCDDTDCQGYYFCQKTEDTYAVCQDKKDNDGDGKTDCNDTDCQVFTFCQTGSESSFAQCQDKVDNDGDGKTDCTDPGCWFWYYCNHYSGFPVTDAWGATWDGLPRAADTYKNAAADCKALGARLPTATELHRNNTQTGGSVISGPGATEYLWTLIADHGSSYRVTLRLSDGTVSNAAETSKVQYRCIWEPTLSATGFVEGRCHGKPGSTCVKHDQIWNIDSQDRPDLYYAAAVNECAFYGASVPTTAEYAEAIHAGLKNGSNTWLWTANAVYWYSGGHGQAGIRWKGTGTADWYFNNSDGFGTVMYTYGSSSSYRHPFRCIGLSSPGSFNVPTATCNGTCLTASDRRSTVKADGIDRAKSDYKTAFATCRAAGGDMPNIGEMTELVHHKWAGGSYNWLWAADALYWHSGGYGYALARWQNAGTEDWSYNGWGTWASLAGGTGTYNYRCIWRQERDPFPSCTSGQVLQYSSGALACATGQKGSSGGKAYPSEVVDPWGSAWDSVERTSATYADAVKICTAAGGRLPTASELYRVRATSNPHSAGVGSSSNTNYLWTTTQSRRSGYLVAVRVSDGKTTTYTTSSTKAPYRCVWPATHSDVLYGNNCYGPPSSPCFTTSEGMVADAYDRVAVDWAAALNECMAVGGHLPSAREMTRLVHQGLSNGSNNWLWLDKPVYWYANGYGYMTTRWSGVGSSSFDISSTYATVSWGYSDRQFRCVYSPYIN